VIGDYSLLYTWKGRSNDLKPILLMGHIDVVRSRSTLKQIGHTRLCRHDCRGFPVGRGAMDDKLAVMGLLEAAEALLKRVFNRCVLSTWPSVMMKRSVEQRCRTDCQPPQSRALSWNTSSMKSGDRHDVLPLLSKPIA